MFYILRNSFMPNTASANRALAYYKAMDVIGVEAKVIILQADAHQSRIDYVFKHLIIEYWWENGFQSRNKYYRRIQYFLNLRRFLKQVKPGDKVYIYGSSHGIHSLLKKKGVGVYLEVTEHPLVHPVITRFGRNTHKKAIDDCRQLNRLFVISNYLKQYYIEEGVPEGVIHVINMFVDVKRFDGLFRSSKDRYICYCGNGNNKKDKVDNLINVFSSIAARFPDVNLMIVGPTQQPYSDEKNNVELVRELGLEDRVTFTGILPSNQIPQILINAELLALDRPNTLQNKAGFATKLGEYLLSGRPVVVTSIGDVPLFLKDKESALVVEPDNPDAFAEKIVWALNNKNDADMIGERGREVASREFNSMIETKKLVSFIQPDC